MKIRVKTSLILPFFLFFGFPITIVYIYFTAILASRTTIDDLTN